MCITGGLRLTFWKWLRFSEMHFEFQFDFICIAFVSFNMINVQFHKKKEWKQVN